ncbi:MAG: hypothetical protein GXO62_01045 [Epsilonproteobacteria bacterium]|nr:hypothetical protein [Campylobacterota bacterium]
MRWLIIAIMSGSFMFAESCDDLMSKYHTPDPTIKTMNQLKRWVRRKLKNVSSNEKEKVLECLIARAADNPNQAEVAGE